MRSFPIIYLVIFLIFYLFLGIIFYFGVKLISKTKKKTKKVLFFTNLYSIVILVTFIALFVYPGQPAESTNYKIYFVFNLVLIADIVAKLIILIFSIPYLILKLFRKNGSLLIYAGFIIASGVYFSVLYGAIFGKNQISIKPAEIYLSDLPASYDGYKIVQISDIHLGSFINNNLFERAVKKINQISPDLVLLTGDLVNNFSNETSGWDHVFNEIKARNGKYAILGNHDYGDYYNWNSEEDKNNNFEEIVTAYKKLGFILLRNESVQLKNNSDSLFLLGVENWGHPPFPQYADLQKAMQEVPSNSFKILMSHDPAHWEIVKQQNHNIALTLSGHTHGLQWGLKPAGIEFSLIKAGSKYWGGLYESSGQYLYVNRGFGTIGMAFRLDMPAEVTLITLKKK